MNESRYILRQVEESPQAMQKHEVATRLAMRGDIKILSDASKMFLVSGVEEEIKSVALDCPGWIAAPEVFYRAEDE